MDNFLSAFDNTLIKIPPDVSGRKMCSEDAVQNIKQRYPPVTYHDVHSPSCTLDLLFSISCLKWQRRKGGF